MTFWNPAFVIRLLGHCTSGNSRSISANDRNLLFCVKCLLGAGRGTFGPLATLSAALQLWEEGLDPRLVDEVEGACEGGEEEEVQEDTAKMMSIINSSHY